MDRVTTHNISYRPNEYFLHKELDTAFRNGGSATGVAIGMTMYWIHAAILLPGVKIGDGASWAQARWSRMTSRHTPSSRAFRQSRCGQRFPQPVAERLQALAWWDWPHERLGEAVDDMRTLSVEAFLEKYER